MLRTTLIALFICCITLFSYAQDSTKKETPVQPEPKVKSYPQKVVVPPATAPAGQPIKHDTAPVLPVLVDKSLNGQYQFLLTKVYHYQQPFVATFWKSVIDTINAGKQKLYSADNRLKLQKKTIDSLNNEITGKDQNYSSSNSHIDVLGMSVDKSTYTLTMLGLVLVCAAITGVIILRSGSHSREAQYRIKLYNELEDEFKAYKTKANEKEKKLARELQTERNKLDELRGNA
ncbi:hypothetical protein [Mucilaginibacter frigoritolerans]|nr:hypothetical protein [Mucilaginibacter frigoritolerans]